MTSKSFLNAVKAKFGADVAQSCSAALQNSGGRSNLEILSGVFGEKHQSSLKEVDDLNGMAFNSIVVSQCEKEEISERRE